MTMSFYFFLLADFHGAQPGRVSDHDQRLRHQRLAVRGLRLPRAAVRADDAAAQPEPLHGGRLHARLHAEPSQPHPPTPLREPFFYTEFCHTFRSLFCSTGLPSFSGVTSYWTVEMFSRNFFFYHYWLRTQFSFSNEFT